MLSPEERQYMENMIEKGEAKQKIAFTIMFTRASNYPLHQVGLTTCENVHESMNEVLEAYNHILFER